MRYQRSRSLLRRWELALLLGLGLSLLLGVWLEREQTALSRDVLRLHVLANSDSPADQDLKLQVRDRILAEAEDILPRTASAQEAAQILSTQLERLAAAGAQAVAQAGYSYPVRASLEESWFPTKQYDGFALPAGRYQALRITIGEGAGHNWWCVVFPPLCLSAAADSTRQTALEAGLDQREVGLLTGENEGYVVKFKALELWDQIKARLSG